MPRQQASKACFQRATVGMQWLYITPRCSSHHALHHLPVTTAFPQNLLQRSVRHAGGLLNYC